MCGCVCRLLSLSSLLQFPPLVTSSARSRMAAAAPNPEDPARSSAAPAPSALAGDGDAEEAEDFTSSSHCSELSRRQNEQRKQGLFCDVTLVFSSGAANGSVQSCEFSAHRSVLAAATDYFTPLLGGQFSESLTGRVEMKEWSSELGPDQETVESVIQYMYTGEIRVSTCNVHEVLELADRYELPTSPVRRCRCWRTGRTRIPTGRGPEYCEQPLIPRRFASLSCLSGSCWCS